MKLKTKRTGIDGARKIPDTDDEKRQWKRFLRESKLDRAVLLALLNARWKHPTESRAAKVYDQFIVQLMAAYVSPAAFNRYHNGVAEDEIDGLRCSSGYAGGVVDAENGMMAALKAIVAEHPANRQKGLEQFIHHLFYRWLYAQMLGEGVLEAISGNGANIKRSGTNVYLLPGSGRWRTVPLLVDDNEGLGAPHNGLTEQAPD